MANFYGKYDGLFGGGGGGGGGDVVGPAGATDNAVARFDGVTGKLIQNSSVIVDDSGNVNGTTYVAGAGTLTNPSFSVPTGAGNAGMYFGVNGMTLAYNLADVMGWNGVGIKSLVKIQSFYNSTASLPAFYLLNDSTTGIYRSAADQWGWSSGGVQVLNFSSTGLDVTGALGLSGTGTVGQLIDLGLTANQIVATDASKQLISQALGNLTDAGTDGITVTGGTGAVIGSGTSISQHVADSTHNGYLSSVDWSTFNAKQSALTLGNLTDAGTDGITVTGGTGAVVGSGTSIAQHVADATHNGYLSSTDWNTFNGKGSGTVTAVSVASANGFAGSSSGGTTPALTLSTSVTGILSGNGTAISAASTQGSGAVVLATSPTITTPTIAKLANLTTNGYVKTSNSDGTLSVQTVAIPVADGGTGQTSYTNGQLLIGNTTGNTLAKSTLTAGANVTITNGNGTITIAASGGGTPPNSIVRVSNAGGNGSTGTKIRWYGTTVVNTGSDITYTSSSVNGDSWTINTTGTYSVCVSDLSNTQANVGISVNQTSLTTNPYSLPDSQLLNLGTAPNADFSEAVSWAGPLSATDVIRICVDTSNVGTVPQRARATVARLS